MIIRPIDFLIRNERARNLSYEQGFCVTVLMPNTSEHNFIHKLIPPARHIRLIIHFISSYSQDLENCDIYVFARFVLTRYFFAGETVVDGSLSGNDGTVVGSIELQSIKIIYRRKKMYIHIGKRLHIYLTVLIFLGACVFSVHANLNDPALFVYYSFDEEGGTVKDGSKNGNDGEVQGNAK